MRAFPIVLTPLLALFLAACGSTPNRTAPLSDVPTTLPDRVAFLQDDPRWADDELGRSGNSMAAEGCLVTAVAMSLANLGIDTDPGELNAALRENGGFTPQGWLVWAGVERVTDGRARAIYHDDVTPALIRGCMAGGDYPLVRFILPSGRSHWAVILGETPLADGRTGYRMRDPLRDYRSPLIFPRSARAFKSLRCVGLANGVRTA